MLGLQVVLGPAPAPSIPRAPSRGSIACVGGVAAQLGANGSGLHERASPVGRGRERASPVGRGQPCVQGVRAVDPRPAPPLRARRVRRMRARGMRARRSRTLPACARWPHIYLFEVLRTSLDFDMKICTDSSVRVRKQGDAHPFTCILIFPKPILVPRRLAPAPPGLARAESSGIPPAHMHFDEAEINAF